MDDKAIEDMIDEVLDKAIAHWLGVDIEIAVKVVKQHMLAYTVTERDDDPTRRHTTSGIVCPHCATGIEVIAVGDGFRGGVDNH